MEVDGSSNFKFVSLNLLKNFENYSENALKMLDSHCELVLEILRNENEEDSLQHLALQVLSKITSSENLFKSIETLKDLLLKIKNKPQKTRKNEAFMTQIINNIFYMLEKKATENPQERIQESIKLFLILDKEVPLINFSSLVSLIGESEDYQKLSLEFIISNF